MQMEKERKKVENSNKFRVISQCVAARFSSVQSSKTTTKLAANLLCEKNKRKIKCAIEKWAYSLMLVFLVFIAVATPIFIYCHSSALHPGFFPFL